MRHRDARVRFSLVVLAACVVVGIAGGSARSSSTTGDVNWGSWGNTANQNRYSPLTQINDSNVSQLGRAFTIDLNQFVPGIKKGMQDYPLIVNGVMYITSGDDQVFAVNATSGALLWHYAPNNIATFKNFGIVANRGVAYCDNTVFLLTLDMTIVAINPLTGQQIARVPISKAVPGAQANYGYSETSAPICADNRLILGAAGSEYGARGFVMAYNVPSLTPAWPNPFWTIPPDNTEWRTAARIVGGGVVWTPTTVDLTTNTLYFGTGAATPPYYPSLRPGPDPRSDSLIAVNLITGQMDWWQQLLTSNQWSYDASQPPMVYTATIGGKKERVVSIATMEGVWFAFNAKTGAPIWQRVKVIDNVEHPNLKPGVPVVIYPSSLGGLNYSPASYDPQTQYVYNAASETASVLVEQTSAEEEKQGLLAGDVFLGLANGDYGQYLQSGWHDYGSISAIDVATGKQVWKFDTPQPERGGPTTTASGLGFVGGGDGVLRVFDVKTGQVLWTFQTGYQIAAGPSIYAVNGTEYIAIGVGGTTTSSSGGTVAAQIQVFDLGASQTQSTAPVIPVTNGVREVQSPSTAAAPLTVSSTSAVTRRSASAGAGGRLIPPASLAIQTWNPNTSNTDTVEGHVTLDGQPVEGASVSIGGWVDPTPTDATGAFDYPADDTMALRHVATVVGDSSATVDGKKLTAAQQSALLGASGGISVGYGVSNVSSHVESNGDIALSGKLSYGQNLAPPTVVLYSYELRGVITNSSGQPVQGAVVTTRTNDRQYWTQSRPSGANGDYASFLVAADEEGDNPVPMEVGVAAGGVSYAEPAADQIDFAKLQSASLNIQLPATPGGALLESTLSPQTIPGAIYQGLVVGVVGGNGGIIKPISATWPDKNGNFSLVLPASAAGLKVNFWEDNRQFFSSTGATPGQNINLSIYPSSLPSDAPQALLSTTLAGTAK
jgi:PQQ-dependent dehydrogenase (methanol/ethanol family)